MERAQLLAARQKKLWSLEEAAQHLDVDKSTLGRWERGEVTPQAYHLRKLCATYETTPRALGFEEYAAATENSAAPDHAPDTAIAAFRQRDLTTRLMSKVWQWPRQYARYFELQTLIMQELAEESHMTEESNELISRRDALCRLALLPIEMSGLSAFMATLTHPAEEILAQCATGITACWYLRHGKELALANSAVSAYIPTLKEIARSSLAKQRTPAAELLVQCYLLKATLARHAQASNESITYAQLAEKYSESLENIPMQILSLRTLASIYYYANRWETALQVAEKAKYLLETTHSTHIQQLAQSYLYAGLANYQAHSGRKQDALTSLRKAHTAFFAQPTGELAPVWIDHNQANLLLNDGMTHFHLGLSKEALDSFSQIDHLRTKSESIRVETLINEAITEMSREDEQPDMERCIDHWTKGIEGAIELQSEQRFNEAVQAYTAMRAAWHSEQRIKELRAHIVHW